MEVQEPHILVIGLAKQRHHIQHALDSGVKMSLLVREERNKPEYTDLFHSVFSAENIFDFEEISSFVEGQGITAVLTRFESYISVVGAVNDILGLDGISYTDTRNFGNKFLMKSKWLESDVPCAAGVNADIRQSVDFFLDNYSFPLILKQASGTHSSFVFKVKNRAELDEKLLFMQQEGVLNRASNPIKHLEDTDSECKLLLEEMLSGIEVTIDSFVSNGVFTHTPICEYILPEDLAIDDSYLPVRSIPTNIPTDVQERLFKMAEEALIALGANNCVCHTEFFYDLDKDTAWVIETTARGGGNRSLMVNHATNNDYDMAIFDAAQGKSIDPFVSNGKALAVVEYFAEKEGILFDMDLDFLHSEKGLTIIKIRNQIGDSVKKAQNGGKSIVTISLEESDVVVLKQKTIDIFRRIQAAIQVS